MAAITGSAGTEAQPIRSATDHVTAWNPRVAPAPMTDAVITCVVEANLSGSSPLLGPERPTRRRRRRWREWSGTTPRGYVPPR